MENAGQILRQDFDVTHRSLLRLRTKSEGIDTLRPTTVAVLLFLQSVSRSFDTTPEPNPTHRLISLLLFGVVIPGRIISAFLPWSILGMMRSGQNAALGDPQWMAPPQPQPHRFSGFMSLRSRQRTTHAGSGVTAWQGQAGHHRRQEEDRSNESAKDQASHLLCWSRVASNLLYGASNVNRQFSPIIISAPHMHLTHRSPSAPYRRASDDQHSLEIHSFKLPRVSVSD